MPSKYFNSFKDFQSDQIQTSSRKLFTVRYTCSNSDLNLKLVTGTTNGFIFQMINSLIESWGGGGGGYACPVLTVTNRLQFSMVYTLINDRNDVMTWLKLKWNHEPQASGFTAKF